jgi:hypothetical protein
MIILQQIVFIGGLLLVSNQILRGFQELSCSHSVLRMFLKTVTLSTHEKQFKRKKINNCNVIIQIEKRGNVYQTKDEKLQLQLK